MQRFFSEDRSRRIQILRGLAIVAVVFIHNTPSGLAQVWCRPFLNFAVGLFLFLSGMLSLAKTWNPLKRIRKVVIPYIIWTMIYVLINNYKEPSHLLSAFIKGLLLGNSAAMMYYVFIYCELTLLIPLIDRLAKSKYRFIGFVISPLEIIVMRLIPLITGVKLNGFISNIMSLSCLGWLIYFYLGYLLGNNYISIKTQKHKTILLWVGAITLQMLEGFWYYSMGVQNCGTQLKLSSILTGILFALLAYQYIDSEKVLKPKSLYFLGNRSFGIFFSHIAVMFVLNRIPYYIKFAIYPINAIVTVVLSAFLVYIGSKVLGKNAKYLAF